MRCEAGDGFGILPEVVVEEFEEESDVGRAEGIAGEAAVAWRQLFGLDDCRFLVLELSEAKL